MEQIELLEYRTVDSIELATPSRNLAHIWIGENDLYNDRRNRVEGVTRTEQICNAVAGELLVK